MRICCNIKPCDLLAEFICKCKKNVFFCHEHVVLHIQMNCGHTPEPTFLDISNSQRTQCLKNINKDIQTLKAAKKNTITRGCFLIETIQNSVKESVNYINETLNHYTYLKNIVATMSRMAKTNDVLLSDFVYEISNNQEDIEKFLSYNIAEHILKSRYDSGFDSQDKLFWMRGQSLTILNLQDFKSTTRIMDIPLNCIQCCQISDNNYFVSTKNELRCFNFNLAKQIFKPLPNGLEINNNGATVFLKDHIYRFGGEKLVHDKFNLSKNTWISIPKPQMISTVNLTGSSVNGFIFLAGLLDNKIYSFDPISEKYSALFAVPPNKVRHLAKNYLVSQEKLYVQEGKGVKKWIAYDYESCEEFTNTLLNSLLVVRGTDIYFILDTLKLIKVDTKQRKIYCVGYN